MTTIEKNISLITASHVMNKLKKAYKEIKDKHSNTEENEATYRRKEKELEIAIKEMNEVFNYNYIPKFE